MVNVHITGIKDGKLAWAALIEISEVSASIIRNDSYNGKVLYVEMMAAKCIEYAKSELPCVHSTIAVTIETIYCLIDNFIAITTKEYYDASIRIP